MGARKHYEPPINADQRGQSQDNDLRSSAFIGGLWSIVFQPPRLRAKGTRAEREGAIVLQRFLDPAILNSIAGLDLIAKKMAPDQIAEAERLAREWKPREQPTATFQLDGPR